MIGIGKLSWTCKIIQNEHSLVNPYVLLVSRESKPLIDYTVLLIIHYLYVVGTT